MTPEVTVRAAGGGRRSSFGLGGSARAAVEPPVSGRVAWRGAARRASGGSGLALCRDPGSCGARGRGAVTTAGGAGRGRLGAAARRAAAAQAWAPGASETQSRAARAGSGVGPRPELPPRGPAPPRLRALRKCGPRPGCCRPRPRLAASGGVAWSLPVWTGSPLYLFLWRTPLRGTTAWGLVSGLIPAHRLQGSEWVSGRHLGICGTERDPRRFRPAWFCTAADALESGPRKRFLKLFASDAPAPKLHLQTLTIEDRLAYLGSPLGS